jgi:hypothetical protein
MLKWTVELVILATVRFFWFFLSFKLIFIIILYIFYILILKINIFLNKNHFKNILYYNSKHCVNNKSFLTRQVSELKASWWLFVEEGGAKT